MIEKMKTILLIVLVVSSLVLSWILIYFIPNNGNTDVAEFLPRYRFGQDQSMDRLTGFQQLVLHYGGNSHSVFYPDMIGNNNQYYPLLQELKKESFYELIEPQGKLDWKEVVENQKGIEIILFGSYPQDVLKSMLLISFEKQMKEPIDRIWITVNAQQQVNVYFLNDQEGKVYQAKTSITPSRIHTLLEQTKNSPQYSYIASDSFGKGIPKFSYLPEDEISLPVYQGSFVEVPDEHLIQLLFLDPTGVRKVDDRSDGQRLIYTDGSKSLQVYASQHMLNFYQPVVRFQHALDLKQGLEMAISYVNQHGGWGGEYYLAFIRSTANQSWEFNFQPYTHGFPLTDNALFAIRVQVSNGMVGFYQRPTIKLLEKNTGSVVKLKKGIMIKEELKNRGITSDNLQSLLLTYHLIEEDELVTFYPYWKIVLKNQKQLEVPAY